MFIGSLQNFLKIMDNVVSPGFTLANQTGQNVAFPILQKGDTALIQQMHVRVRDPCTYLNQTY